MNYLKIDKIQNELDTKFIGKNMVYFKSIDSTNTFASNLIKEGLSCHENSISEKRFGTVIVAETQYRGLGRHEKSWFSPLGGLWFSIILNPFYRKPEANFFQLSKFILISAAVIFEVLMDRKSGIDENDPSADLSLNLKIKWPNDIYYKDRKLAGILSESGKINGQIYLVIGIGINVNFKIEKKQPKGLNAISLLDICGKQVDRDILFARILNLFEKKYVYFLKTDDFKSIFKPVEKYLIF